MFIVYLTYYTGDKLPPFYIGSTSLDRHLSGYTGSVCSRKWSDIYYIEKAANPKLFKSRILSYHKTRREVAIEELRVQLMHNVVKSSKYFNEAYATKDGCFTGDKSGRLNPMFGRGYKLAGNKNGRHVDNFEGDLTIVGERISESLRKSKKNKKGLNPAAKKYYVYFKPYDFYIDIDKGYLYRFCEIFNLKYGTLFSTLTTKKPTSDKNHKRWGLSPNAGYQLFEGTYIE